MVSHILDLTITPSPHHILIQADQFQGYTQSGPLFHAKTRALEKSVIKAFPSSTLYYPRTESPFNNR